MMMIWTSLAPLARSLIAQQQPLQHRMRVLTAAPEVTSSRVSSAGCLRRVRVAVPCRASAPLQQCAGVRQGLRLAHGVQQRAVLRVNNRCSRALVVVSASATGKELVPDTEFTITKVSFGSIGLGVGLTLLVAGFLGYFNFVGSSADNSISALLLIYGFPISLIGFALKYAELQPLVCESYADAVALRATQATPIMQQVRSDVTRFRYGDEQHLDEALARIFRINKSGGIRRTQSPVLVRLREEVVNDKYALVLGFASALAFEEWETRRAKFESFFGPGVSAVLTQTENGVDVTLISDGSQAGGLADDEEVLPPLMPGLPPRVVKKGSKQ